MTEKAKRGRPRSSAVDRAILTQAFDLFVEGGLENVSYDQISKRSGISRAAIYRRWASRPLLLTSAIESHVREDLDVQPDWSKMNYQARLAWFINQAPKLIVSPFFRRLAGEVLARPNGHPDLNFIFHESISRPQKLAFGRLIQAAIMEEVIDAKAPTELIYDMVFGALVARTLSNPNGATEDDQRRYLLDLLTTLGLRS